MRDIKKVDKIGWVEEKRQGVARLQGMEYKHLDGLCA